MKPYKIKHVPTGLYYQPHKFRGSHLSKKGKIYQSKTNGLSNHMNTGRDKFYVWCEVGSRVYKQTVDLLDWGNERNYRRGQVQAVTYVKDWIIEEI